MNTSFRVLKYAAMFVMLFALSSCVHFHNNKFGKEKNEERVRLSLPVIKDTWKLDASIYYPAPKNHSLWFTQSRTEDKSLPYHAYKTIYYAGDTLVAEKDTYLNMNYKWFENGKEVNGGNGALQKKFAKYHALNIVYVYKSVNAVEKNFSSYAQGFTYEIQGEKDGLSDVQNINSKEAEEILQGWNLKRLNY